MKLLMVRNPPEKISINKVNVKRILKLINTIILYTYSQHPTTQNYLKTMFQSKIFHNGLNIFSEESDT